MKWNVIQPLAGGMVLGAEKALGCLPEFIVSQKPFEFNDSFLLDYYGDKVPYYFLEDEPELNYTETDITVSVPVCAGLSQLNSSKTRGSDAPQNDNMLFNANYALSVIKPKVYIFENAPALYTTVGEAVANKLRELGEKNGYSMTLYKTSTHLHGLPQKRHRTFALFWKDSKCPLMEYENVPSNLVDFLNEIPSDAPYMETYINNDILNDSFYKYIKEKKLGRFAGQSFLTIIAKNDLLEDFAYSTDSERAKDIALRVYGKLKEGKNFWDHTSYFLNPEYIGAIQGRIYGRTIHPTEDRDLSIRELITLMGHPLDYMLKDDPLKYIHVIGQNVPVTTAAFITSQAKKFLDGELPMTDETFTRQDNTKCKQSEVSLHDFF